MFVVFIRKQPCYDILRWKSWRKLCW